MFYCTDLLTHDEISSKIQFIFTIPFEQYDQTLSQTSELFTKIKLCGLSEWNATSKDLYNPFLHISEASNMTVFNILLVVLKINMIYTILENIARLETACSVRFTPLNFHTIFISFDEIVDDKNVLNFEKLNVSLNLSDEHEFNNIMKQLQLYVVCVGGNALKATSNSITKLYNSQLNHE
jgi:hypothetical protein